MARFWKKVSAVLLAGALLLSLMPAVMAEEADAFPIVSVELDPITITEGTNGEAVSDEDFGDYYKYNWLQLVSGTATFADGTTVEFTAPGFEHDGKQYYLAYHDDQTVEHWKGGLSYSVTLFVEGEGGIAQNDYLSVYPKVAVEHDFDESSPRVCKFCGEVESNISWVVDESGVLTVSGTGPIKNYSLMGANTPPWRSSGVVAAVIEEGVTHIGNTSFSHNESLSSVSLPSTLVSIGNNAFYMCASLTEVKLPDGVTSIGKSAFSNSGLTEITIPASVTTIGGGAFSAASSLTSATFLGDAPTDVSVEPGMFAGLTLTVNYPADNATWTEEVKANIGMHATVTWNTFEHDWAEATCTAPKTCKTCGTTVGEALGHDWLDATCAAPKTCKVCGATEGEALGHDYAAATCASPKTCKVCGATEGEALGHDWLGATCTSPKICKVCGATEGEALGHDYAAATCASPKTCKVCGTTEGAVIDHADANTDNKCDMCGKLMKTVDIDTDGDGKADLNIDTDADGKADVNMDRDGDNRADLNVDTDGDGKADENVDTDGDGLPNYQVVEGNNGQHVKSEQNDLTFKVNGLISGFQGLELNGQPVAEENYEVREGSTVVTLKGAYLATLEEGDYQLAVVYTDGKTDYSFAVALAEEKPTEPAPTDPTKPEADKDNPQTGDTAALLPWTVTLLAAAVLLFILAVSKKKLAK